MAPAKPRRVWIPLQRSRSTPNTKSGGVFELSATAVYGAKFRCSEPASFSRWANSAANPGGAGKSGACSQCLAGMDQHRLSTRPKGQTSSVCDSPRRRTAALLAGYR